MAKSPKWSAAITHPKKRDVNVKGSFDSEGEALEAARARHDSERAKWGHGATLVLTCGANVREYAA